MTANSGQEAAQFFVEQDPRVKVRARERLRNAGVAELPLLEPVGQRTFHMASTPLSLLLPSSLVAARSVRSDVDEQLARGHMRPDHRFDCRCLVCVDCRRCSHWQSNSMLTTRKQKQKQTDHAILPFWYRKENPGRQSPKTRNQRTSRLGLTSPDEYQIAKRQKKGGIEGET